MKWINCNDPRPIKVDAVCRRIGYTDTLDRDTLLNQLGDGRAKAIDWEWLDESPESPSPSHGVESLNNSMFMNGGNSDEEKALYKMGFMSGMKENNVQVQGVQEAAEAYVRENGFPHFRYACSPHDIQDTNALSHFYSYLAGWVAKCSTIEAQQTGDDHKITGERTFDLNALYQHLMKTQQFEYADLVRDIVRAFKINPAARLLTREVFDKIWDAAKQWVLFHFELTNNPIAPVDKETFYKSLNIKS